MEFYILVDLTTYYAVASYALLACFQNDALRRSDRAQIELLFLAPPAGTIRQRIDVLLRGHPLIMLFKNPRPYQLVFWRDKPSFQNHSRFHPMAKFWACLVVPLTLRDNCTSAPWDKKSCPVHMGKLHYWPIDYCGSNEVHVRSLSLF